MIYKFNTGKEGVNTYLELSSNQVEGKKLQNIYHKDLLIF